MKRREFVCLGLGLLAGYGIETAAGGEDGPRMRRWTDITGKHSVVAELVDFSDGQVRLKKQNGEVVSLPLEKLSPADQRFVQQAAGRRQPVTLRLRRTIDAHEGWVNTLAFFPNGRMLVTGGRGSEVGNELKLWEVVTGKRRSVLSGQQSVVRAVAVSPDGKTVASAGGVPGIVGTDGRFVLWDVVARKPKLIRSAPSPYARDRSGMRQFRCVAFSPNGKIMAVGGMGSKPWGPPGPSGDRAARSQGVIELWDTATGKQTATLEAHGAHVNSAAFSPDGKTLASGGSDKTIKLWDAVTGKLKTTREGGGFHCLVFSPDGKTLAAASGGSVVLLDRAAKLKQKAGLRFRGAVNSVAFSADGNILAAGGGLLKSRGLIMLWDAATGEPLATLWEHTDEITCIAFSPDGRKLASGSRDGTVKLWNVATKAEVPPPQPAGQ